MACAADAGKLVLADFDKNGIKQNEAAMVRLDESEPSTKKFVSEPPVESPVFWNAELKGGA